MKSFLKIIAATVLTAIVFPTGAYAEGDAAAGEANFNKKCKICHTTEQGGDAKIGPNLFGVHNMKAGQFAGYKYSKGLIEADLTWDDATLDAYLLKPRDVVKRGKMVFAGLRKPEERADMIAYLKTLK